MPLGSKAPAHDRAVIGFGETYGSMRGDVVNGPEYAGGVRVGERAVLGREELARAFAKDGVVTEMA